MVFYLVGEESDAFLNDGSDSSIRLSAKHNSLAVAQLLITTLCLQLGSQARNQSLQKAHYR